MYRLYRLFINSLDLCRYLQQLFLSCRIIKSVMSIIHINLACTLFVAYLLFLVGVRQTEHKVILIHITFNVQMYVLLVPTFLCCSYAIHVKSTINRKLTLKWNKWPVWFAIALFVTFVCLLRLFVCYVCLFVGFKIAPTAYVVWRLSSY